MLLLGPTRQLGTAEYNDISYFPQIGSEFLQLIHVNLFREINLQTKV